MILPVLPIDTGRYGTTSMVAVFEQKNWMQRMLDVEAAIAWAQGTVGDIPMEDAEKIMQMSSTRYVKISRVKEIEKEIKHDIMSLVRALSEVSGSSGAYVHLGVTSYDIVDTARALQLREAVNLIDQKLDRLEFMLIQKAKQNKNTIMIGRTHGQHALPITLGLKIAVWMREISRHIQRLNDCKKRLIVGKITGAVGTQAGLGSNAIEIQRLVMKKLEISSVEVSTQIIQRDRHAEFICTLSIIASTLNKIATEIRELQRTEIHEVLEPFEKEKQVGSSTMPNKRNPELCERICGLAKIVQSLVFPALQNVSTWNERDLTQSSSERFLIPEACILTDYILQLMIKVISGMETNKEKMLQNIDLTGGLIMSERLMLALTKKGMARQRAHELMRKLAIESSTTKSTFKEILIATPIIKKFMDNKEIEYLLDPKGYLGTAAEQIDNAVKKTNLDRQHRMSNR